MRCLAPLESCVCLSVCLSVCLRLCLCACMCFQRMGLIGRKGSARTLTYPPPTHAHTHTHLWQEEERAAVSATPTSSHRRRPRSSPGAAAPSSPSHAAPRDPKGYGRQTDSTSDSTSHVNFTSNVGSSHGIDISGIVRPKPTRSVLVYRPINVYIYIFIYICMCVYIYIIYIICICIYMHTADGLSSCTGPPMALWPRDTSVTVLC